MTIRRKIGGKPAVSNSVNINMTVELREYIMICNYPGRPHIASATRQCTCTCYNHTVWWWCTRSLLDHVSSEDNFILVIPIPSLVKTDVSTERSTAVRQLQREINRIVFCSGVFRMCERRGPGESPSGVQGQRPGRGFGDEVPRSLRFLL